VVGQEVQGAHQGGEPSLHVDGAGGEQPVAGPLRRPGGEDRVEVPEEEEVAAGRVRPAGEEEREPLLLPHLGSQAARRERRGEEAGRSAESLPVSARRGEGRQVGEEGEGAREDRLGEREGRHDRDVYRKRLPNL